MEGGAICPTNEKQVDIQAKITDVINSIFKPNLVQKQTTLRVYTVLAKSTSDYGSEVWTIKKQDEK
jgi:hypothetical protein